MDGASGAFAACEDPLPRLSKAGFEGVFLHSGWRTAGTWIWSRFLNEPEAMGFYEPLHERLASMRGADIGIANAEGWDSGHPDLGRPYFSEFRGVIGPWRAGAPGYRVSFARDVFFEDAEAADLEKYLRRLIGRAAASQRRAVLKFCRSLGRSDWMMRHFPNVLHVAVVTDPVRQSRSARRQFLLHGNPYFIAAPFATLAANARHPRVGAVLERMKVRLPPSPAAARAHVFGLDPEACYRGLLAFWLLSMLSIPDDIHEVVDTGLLRASEQHRGAVERRLTTLTGWEIDLSGARRDDAASAGIDWLGLSAGARRRCHHDARSAAIADAREHPGRAGDDSARRSRIDEMLAVADLLLVGGGERRDIRVERLPEFGESAGDAQPSRLAFERERAARAQADQRSAELAARLGAVLASTSWAITAPLRAVGERVRSLVWADRRLL